MPAPCVVFTGHSGINMTLCLQRLADFIERQTKQRPHIVKLETAMTDEHLRRYPDVPNRLVLSQRGGFQYLLMEPKRYLNDVWEASARASLADVDRTDPLLLVGLHSVFFNTTSRDFFPAGDYHLLEAVFKERELGVARVITLVDDIYDAWARLAQPDELFADTDSVVQAILDLMLLLHWRSMEIFASEQLARTLGADHYVLAIKHPLSVAYDLALSDKRPLYVAHPISEIRALQQRGGHDLAEDAQREIELLIQGLLGSSRIVPIFPTTIDELRIAREGGHLIPRLEERWRAPIPDDETLAGPGDPKLRSPFVFTTADAQSETMAGLLEGLRSAVESQVNSRDRKLVEQTKGLVAWRPCFRGNVSGGVSNEINHRNLLVARGEEQSTRKAVVLMRPEDIGLYRSGSAFNMITKRAESLGDKEALLGRLLGLEGEFSSQAVDGQRLREVADPDGRIRFPLSRSARSALGPHRATVARQEAQTHWDEIAADACRDWPPFGFHEADCVSAGTRMTTGEFIAEVERCIAAG